MAAVAYTRHLGTRMSCLPGWYVCIHSSQSIHSNSSRFQLTGSTLPPEQSQWQHGTSTSLNHVQLTWRPELTTRSNRWCHQMGTTLQRPSVSGARELSKILMSPSLVHLRAPGREMRPRGQGVHLPSRLAFSIKVPGGHSLHSVSLPQVAM